MPPAFNLSQDQTLQFNLCLKLTHFGIEVNFTTSEFHFVFREYLVITLAITANFHQTPTLIGCQFLKNISDWLQPLSTGSLSLLSSAQKRDYHPLLPFLSSASKRFLIFFSKQPTPEAGRW